MISYMATKTISLELDAYERLRSAKLGDKESFSSVVRRAVFCPASHSGSAILRHLADLPQDIVSVPELVDYWDRASSEDAARPRSSPSEWGSADAP